MKKEELIKECQRKLKMKKSECSERTVVELRGLLRDVPKLKKNEKSSQLSSKSHKMSKQYLCLVEVQDHVFVSYYDLETFPKQTLKFLEKYDTASHPDHPRLRRKDSCEYDSKKQLWYEIDDGKHYFPYIPLSEPLSSNHIFNGKVKTVVYDERRPTNL